jgi:hypothetical protein
LQKTNNNKQPIATPSLISGQKGTVIRPVPVLTTFVKSNGTIELESRSVGIYDLKKNHTEKMNIDKKWLVLTYKIGKTKYRITSLTYTTIPKQRATTEEGTIEISKGLWNSQVFKYVDLPKNIVDSINENINKFNQEWNEQVKLDQQKAKEKVLSENDKFFKGLDT